MTTTTQIKPRGQDRTTLALLFVAALVAVGGIGFAIGHLTGSSAAAANNNGGNGFGRNGNGGFVRPSLAPGQTFNPGQFAGGGAGGFGREFGAGAITGTVQSINGSTLTLQLSNGSTVTIDLTGSTTYHATTAASASDVTTGSTVTVQIDTSALASESPNPSASGVLGGRTITAKDVLISTP